MPIPHAHSLLARPGPCWGNGGWWVTAVTMTGTSTRTTKNRRCYYQKMEFFWADKKRKEKNKKCLHSILCPIYNDKEIETQRSSATYPGYTQQVTVTARFNTRSTYLWGPGSCHCTSYILIITKPFALLYFKWQFFVIVIFWTRARDNFYSFVGHRLLLESSSH